MRDLARLSAVSLAAVLAVGCTSPQRAQVSDEDRLEALKLLRCDDPAQCDLYWRRAQLWITQNSVWRIQIANDVLIENAGPIGNSSVDRAYRATREHQADGRGVITLTSACANLFGCRVAAETSAAAFKRFVRSSTP